MSDWMRGFFVGNLAAVTGQALAREYYEVAAIATVFALLITFYPRRFSSHPDPSPASTQEKA